MSGSPEVRVGTTTLPDADPARRYGAQDARAGIRPARQRAERLATGVGAGGDRLALAGPHRAPATGVRTSPVCDTRFRRRILCDIGFSDPRELAQQSAAAELCSRPRSSHPAGDVGLPGRDRVRHRADRCCHPRRFGREVADIRWAAALRGQKQRRRVCPIRYRGNAERRALPGHVERIPVDSAVRGAAVHCRRRPRSGRDPGSPLAFPGRLRAGLGVVGAGSLPARRGNGGGANRAPGSHVRGRRADASLPRRHSRAMVACRGERGHRAGGQSAVA